MNHHNRTMKTTTTARQPEGWTDKQVNDWIGDYLLPAFVLVFVALTIRALSR